MKRPNAVRCVYTLRNAKNMAQVLLLQIMRTLHLEYMVQLEWSCSEYMKTSFPPWHYKLLQKKTLHTLRMEEKNGGKKRGK